MEFPDTDDRRPEIIIACVVGTVLAVLSTIGRLAARYRTKAPLKSDDWLIIVGLIMALAVVASTLVMVHFGLGRHVDKVTSPQGLVQAVVSSQILYSFSVVPIKVSRGQALAYVSMLLDDMLTCETAEHPIPLPSPVPVAKPS